MRSSPWISSLLDGANLAPFGLMATVTWRLWQADPLTGGIALESLALLDHHKVNSTWLIEGGAFLGLLKAFL